MVELKDLLEAQAKAFEDFKQANDQRLAEIEKGGKAHEATEAKVAAINAEMNKIADALKANERELARLAVYAGPAGDGKLVLTPEQKQYGEAFFGIKGYVRKGIEDGLAELGRKAASVGSDPDGGYWVPVTTSSRIVERLFETTAMRRLATIETIGSDELEGMTDLNDATSEGWVSEMGARSEDTAVPPTGMWKIPVHEQYAEPQATQKMLDDSVRDFEGWLSRKVADKFARVENAAFITGNGVGKPRGLLTYPTAATADASRAWGTFEHVATGTSGGFGTAPNGSDKLIDLVHKLKTAYRAGASWLMTRATVGEVRKLKDGQGNYLWLPSMVANQPATLLGYGVEEGEDMPVIAANSLSIAFGNFREGYTIVDRAGIRVLRDPYTRKGFVKFFTVKRVGGAALNFDAVKFLKFA